MAELYKLPTVIELENCSQCKIKTTQLKTMDCEHSFCQECSKHLPKTGEEINCPQCEQEQKIRIANCWKARKEKINKLQTSSKFDEVLRLVAAHQTENVVVFNRYTTSLRLLKMVMKLDRNKTSIGNRKILLLVGKQFCDQEKVLQQVYTAKQGSYILLASIYVGNLGLNFITATVAIIMTPMWNPHTEIQALQRISRIGQTRETTTYKLYVNSLHDESVKKVQHKKLNSSNEILSATKTQLAMVQMEDMISCFTNDFVTQK